MKGDKYYDENMHRLFIRTKGWPAREQGIPWRGVAPRQVELEAGPEGKRPFRYTSSKTEFAKKWPGARAGRLSSV